MPRYSHGIATILCLLLGTNALRADVLTDAIPADAKAVVLLGDANELEAEIKDFTQNLGFPIPPEIDLQTLLATFGVPDVWDVEEGLALVVREPSAAGVAFVVPCENTEKAREALNAEETDDEDIYAAQIGGSDVFLLEAEGALVVTMDAAGLEAYDDPEETLTDVLTKEQLDVRGEMDVFFFVNVEAWRPDMLAGLEEADAAMEQIQDFPQAEGAGLMTPAMLSEMMKGYMKGARSLVEQTDAIYGGLYLEKEAIHMEIDADFAEGSYLAKALRPSGQKPSEMLADLPDMPFFMVMSAEMEPFRAVMTELLAAFAKMMAKEADLEKSLADSAKYLKWVKSYTSLTAFTEEGPISIGRFETDNPDALVKDMVEAALNATDFNRLMMPAIQKPTHTTKMVQGIKVDELVYDFSKVMDDPAMATSFRMTVGPSGKLRAQIAVLDSGVIYAQGDSEQDDPVTFYLDKKGRLIEQERIQAVVKELPETTSAFALLDVFGLMEMFKVMAQQGDFPNPFQFEAPAELPPPIAFSLSVEEGGLSADIAVPAKLVRTLIDIGVQQMQQVQQVQP